jgi:hypothetical protein
LENYCKISNILYSSRANFGGWDIVGHGKSTLKGNVNLEVTLKVYDFPCHEMLRVT